ncbi:Flp family type IVb pilin [Sinorhizobium sp. BG8]|uniref:Flp family type IVb pilin n=1 Tax=Sinorhizobium sp. BG8 TaxID=2613773 RepID=UPI00193D4E62|nr:Flp family type IVb pilin [Sinorhizobium sp. BG8]QRM53410.1 Flp family type IVb pilin [Sinorhizobium sp. BG8]
MIENFIKPFLKDERGATAVEYGLLAALIAIGLLSGLTAFSDSLNNVFMTIDTSINEAG